MPKRKATVLVVDADAVHRQSVRGILRSHGYRVLDAKDFQNAVNVHQQYQGEINLLLTAISLPGSNGYDLARRLSGIEPGLAVLFVSGEAGAKLTPFHGTPWGDRHHLSRPFDPKDLLERVRQLLEPEPFSAGASM